MTILQLPAYIPNEVCINVGLDPSASPDDCMKLLREDVAADSVSAPAADVPGLRNIVQEANADGIDLKVVVVARNPGMDTALRDVATVIGADDPNSTVLVLSPSYVGSYSGQFHRAKLEAGEDHAKTGVPVVSAQNFLNELNTPDLPWTGLTVAVLILVAGAVAGTRWLQRLAKRAEQV